MSLTKHDLMAIKRLIDTSIVERVPEIIDERLSERVPKIIDERLPTLLNTHVQPMLDKLEKRLVHKLDQLRFDVGQFSLETTGNFMKLHGRIDDVADKLEQTYELADANRAETQKVKQKLDLA